MKKGILTSVTLFLCCLPLTAQITEVQTLEPVKKYLEKIDHQSFVLFDVDETLLLPKDLILKPFVRDKFKKYAAETILNPALIDVKKYDERYFLALILSQIEYEVVDPQAIEMVRSLQKRRIKTIAFTKMYTGPFGPIASLEEWRIEHLKKNHFNFSSSFPEFSEIKLGDVTSNKRHSLFKKGVLFADNQEKGPVFAAFLEKIRWKPKKVIFIDNRLDYLQSVEAALASTPIEFIGFHYTEVERRPPVVNEELAKFQLMHLAKTRKWLSDIEALKLMKN